MVVCQNKNPSQVATNWEHWAKDAQLPVEEIRACVNGPEGRLLLGASFDRAPAVPHARLEAHAVRASVANLESSASIDSANRALLRVDGPHRE
jgi:hypothetical protein